MEDAKYFLGRSCFFPQLDIMLIYSCDNFISVLHFMRIL